MKNIVVLTGAGISAESGLKTFRDANGLWEGHDVMQVASPQGFNTNPDLVMDFYNQRRRQLLGVKPNAAHYDLVALEKYHKVKIITQNVDDLHERAGSTNVLHLHGELLKVRSMSDASVVLNWSRDLVMGDTDGNGHQLRPHVVWFGEDVPKIEPAIKLCEHADILIIVGTSMQVYPAASLMHYVPELTPVYFIDPKPSIKSSKRIKVVAKPATIGVKEIVEALKTV